MGRNLGGKLRYSYREEATYYGDSKAGDGHIEGLCSWQASLLKEIGRVSTERIAIKSLDTVDTNDDHCPAKISGIKTSSIRRLLINLALMLRCDYYQGKILLEIEVDVFSGGEVFYHLSGFLHPTPSNEPPR